MLGFDKHCLCSNCDICITGLSFTRLAAHRCALHRCLLAIHMGGRLMTKAELLKQKLELAKMLANAKTPNEPSLSYDSGWRDPDDKTLLSYSYITLDI